MNSPVTHLYRTSGQIGNEAGGGAVVSFGESAAGPQHLHELPDEFDVGRVVGVRPWADDDPVDEGAGGFQHIRTVVGSKRLPEVPDPLCIESGDVRVQARRRGLGRPALQFSFSSLQLFELALQPGGPHATCDRVDQVFDLAIDGQQFALLGVKRPFNRGRLSTPMLLPLSGSGSFPRSEPHDRVRGGRLEVVPGFRTDG